MQVSFAYLIHSMLHSTTAGHYTAGHYNTVQANTTYMYCVLVLLKHVWRIRSFTLLCVFCARKPVECNALCRCVEGGGEAV